MSLIVTEGGRILAADLAIPRTGSTWRGQVYQYLGWDVSQHGFSLHDPDFPEDAPLKVTFVRHPVTWLRSRFTIGKLAGIFSDELDPFAQADFSNFTRYLEFYLDSEPGLVTRYFQHFISRADFVGRMESIKLDLCQIYGLDAEKIQQIWMAPVIGSNEREQRLLRISETQLREVFEREKHIIDHYYRRV